MNCMFCQAKFKYHFPTKDMSKAHKRLLCQFKYVTLEISLFLCIRVRMSEVFI